MPAPGDIGAAQLRVRLRDVLWDVLYSPTASLVNFAADRLNKVQFLSIRGYLTLVFSALVVLLMVLAAWQ
jgi:hydrogenase-4 component B